MKLGIDLDGVLFPFAENFRDYCLKVGVDIPDAPIVKWAFYEDWSIARDQFFVLFSQGVNDGFIFLEHEPYPDSVEALCRLHDEGHGLHIITHRMIGSKSAHNTFDWLSRYDVPFDSVTFAEDKTFIQVDLLLEDKIENCYASIDAGIPARLLARPWNEDADPALRIDSWQEFYETVNEWQS